MPIRPALAALAVLLLAGCAAPNQTAQDCAWVRSPFGDDDGAGESLKCGAELRTHYIGFGRIPDHLRGL
ncbi:MAG TPA: hypothetical protein VEH84_03120 [Alphaproteobacteria bacterium]|nr:hypothetical protein [Alphaproteobacteria bacterium]